jgi:hypothetical protein
MRRGLFIEDYLYSISNIAVQAHALDGLELTAAAALPPPPGLPPIETPPFGGLPGIP